MVSPISNPGNDNHYINSNWITFNLMVVSSAESTIRSCGNLSSNEYRTLLKTYETGRSIVCAEDIAYMLALDTDTVVRAMSMLEKQQLVTNETLPNQSSKKSVSITTIGIFRITSIDAALYQQTLSIFRNHLCAQDYELICQCMYKAGGVFEHSLLSEPQRALSITSNTFACMLAFGKMLHDNLSKAANMTFTETRILHYLSENKHPASLKLLATDMFLVESKAKRAIYKLVLAGYIKEIPSENPDVPTSYYLTNENHPTLRIISNVLQSFSRQYLLSALDERENEIVKHIGDLVIGDMRAQDSSAQRNGAPALTDDAQRAINAK